MIPYNSVVNAIRDSAEHWERDICEPLREGDVIVDGYGGLCWQSSGEPVLLGSKQCHLCSLFFRLLSICENCPLELAGDGCIHVDQSSYHTFIGGPTLENAEAMRDSIIRLLQFPFLWMCE